MKKYLLTVWFLLIFSLCGCSRLIPFELTDNDGTTLLPTPIPLAGTDIETLKSWSFQFNEGTNDYSVFFALLNKDDEYISGDVDIDIRIVNDNNEEVYKGTKSVSKKISVIIRVRPPENNILQMSGFPHRKFLPEHLQTEQCL